MDKLLSWVRSFGNLGAVANAGKLRAQHRREDWILKGLTARIADAFEEATAEVA
jgi:hypothetical protein